MLMTCSGAQHIHKAPITKMKQVDHILNERRLLEAAGSNFCVRLMAAYQDQKDLMLLQEWVGGTLCKLQDVPPTSRVCRSVMLLEVPRSKGGWR